MRKPIIITLTILALLTLPTCQSAPISEMEGKEWMFTWTGEENLPHQVRGMAQLAANLLHPQPRTAADVPVTYAGLNPFGINVFLEQEVEEQKREKALQMIAAAGFHWIRQGFTWEDIEIHGNGDFEDRRNEPHRSAWEKYDHIVGLAEQYDLEIIARLSNPPAWTRADGDTRGHNAPPDDLADWGDYIYAVASRYRGRVRYYQLWNEPNIYPEWGEQPVDPEGYTRLLCEGYRRAKEADPDVVIISGALAPTVSLHPGPGPGTGLSDFIFLQRMYDAGAGACFDVLSVNDYMLWSGPTDHRMQPLNINFARPVYIRDIMVANGDAAKPVWISEMNSNAVPNDPGIQDWIRYGQVTPEQQAHYAVLAYQRAMEEWPWVGVVNFWFFKRADDTEQGQSWYYFRMVEPDFTPMPVYETMREYTAGLTPTLYPGTHQEDHWALEYEGDWETVRETVANQEAYRQTITPGATLRFTFEGASLTLVPGPGTGEIEVSVNGAEPRRVALAGEPVRLAGRGRHAVTLAALSGVVAVDGLIVRAAWHPSPRLILGIAGLLLIIALWTRPRLLRRR
ncbi:MAG: hypothetical protein SWK90_04340 [Chloroflexota bacterium]|nr:hypothetical protein [Chloroflexota bacterium]